MVFLYSSSRAFVANLQFQVGTHFGSGDAFNPIDNDQNTVKGSEDVSSSFTLLMDGGERQHRWLGGW